MKRIVVITLFATATMAADAPCIEGLWIQHDEWRYAPKDISEDGDVRKNADAAVMNFCAGGEFRLATGVIYQSKKSPVVMIGASDGLAIYRGTWRQAARRVSLTYRLVDAEFADLMSDPVASAPQSAEFDTNAERIDFPFTSVFGKPSRLRFTPAARYEKRVLDEWVKCGPKQG